MQPQEYQNKVIVLFKELQRQYMNTMPDTINQNNITSLLDEHYHVVMLPDVRIEIHRFNDNTPEYIKSLLNALLELAKARVIVEHQST